MAGGNPIEKAMKSGSLDNSEDLILIAVKGIAPWLLFALISAAGWFCYCICSCCNCCCAKSC